MKKLFSAIVAMLIITVSPAQYSYQVINSQLVNKSIERIAYDNNGNTIITGHFGATISFGSFTLNNNIPNSNTQAAAFIVKMLPNGSYSFAKVINLVAVGNNSSYFMAHINGLSTDAAGNIYMAGSYRGKISFDNITLTSQKSGADYTIDIFIVKMSPTGVFLWARSAGTGIDAGCNTRDEARSVTTDNLGNVYAAGSYVHKVFKNAGGCSQCPTCPPCPVSTTNRSVSGVYVVKYNSSGTKVWEKNYVNSLADASSSACFYNPFANSIVSDGTNLYVTGQIYGSVNFGNVTLNTADNITSNVFLLKLDGNGGTIWARSPNENWNGSFNSNGCLFVDNSGVYIGGTFFYAMSFGSCTLTAEPNRAYVVKFSSSGTCLWARHPGGSPNGFATYPNGNLAWLLRNDPIYWVKEILPLDGSTIDSTSAIHNPNSEHGHPLPGITTLPDGFIFSENLRGSYELGGITISSTQPLGSNYRDMILVKYTVPAPPFAQSKISTTEPLSIKTRERLPGMTLYPNPTSNQITIQNNNNKLLGALSIYDISGKMIYKKLVGRSHTTIDVKNFSAGVYYIRSDQLQAAIKFVKQ